MSLRAQPPVYSPLTARAIAGGLRAALGDGAARRRRLRNALAAQYGVSTVALTDSGTSALGLAMRLAAARRPGRPVLLPAWGCFDLATAALAADVSLAFYDIDPLTLEPDWDSLGVAARLEPAAAVAVHFYGVPISIARFEEIVRPSGAVIIEDAAQAAGAEIGGKLAGSFGDLAVLSFGRGKGTTGGKGGALLARDGAFAADIAHLPLPASRGSLGEVAALAAQWLLTRPSLYGLPAGLPFLGLGQTVFQAPHAAGGITALAAGVLETTLLLADDERRLRRLHAAYLLEHLRSGKVEATRSSSGSPGWLRFPVRLRGGGAQQVAGDTTARALGIYPSYPRPLGELPGIAQRTTGSIEVPPGARALVDSLLTLPTHSSAEEADLHRVVAWCSGGS